MQNITFNWKPLLLTLILSVLFAVAIVQVSQLILIEEHRYSPQLISVIFILTTIVAVLREFRDKEIDPFHPLVMFSVSFLIGYILPLVTFSITSEQTFFSEAGYRNYSQDKQLVSSALLVAYIGYIALWVGYNFATSQQIIVKNRSLKYSVNQERFVILSIIYGGFALAVWGSLIFSFGGISGLIAGFSSRLEAMSGRYYLIVGPLVLVTLSSIWLVARQLAPDSQRPRKLPFYFLIGANLLMLVLNSGSRAPVLVCVLGFFVIRHYVGRKIMFIELAMIFALLVVAYLAYAVYFREFYVLGYLVDDPYSTGSDSLVVQTFSRLTAGSAIMLQTLMIIVRGVPEVLPFQNGETLISLLVSPIPRSIFANKPISPAGVFSEAFVPTLWSRGTSVPPSLIGEFYMNGGVFAVIIGMFVVGALFRRLYERYVINAHSPLQIPIYAFAVVNIYPWMRGETFGPTILYLLLTIPLIFARWYIESDPTDHIP